MLNLIFSNRHFIFTQLGPFKNRFSNPKWYNRSLNIKHYQVFEIIWIVQRIKDNKIPLQNNLASKTSQPIYKHKLSGCCYETRLLIVVRGAKAIKIFQILVIDPKLVFRF